VKGLAGGMELAALKVQKRNNRAT